jgi:hypothetical protein
MNQKLDFEKNMKINNNKRAKALKFNAVYSIISGLKARAIKNRAIKDREIENRAIEKLKDFRLLQKKCSLKLQLGF